MPTLPAPPQLLLSHLELKLSVPSVGVVTPCAAEPRFYHWPDAAGPTGVRALCGREGGREAGTAAVLTPLGFMPQLFL